MSQFLGRYEFQMDEKGRVSLPSAFRKETDETRFVLLQWETPYLTLYPESGWKRVQERLLEYRRAGPQEARFVREVTSNAVEVSPDKQGRILIPSWLQKAAGLEGPVLLNGNLDRIEIWNPEIYGEEVPGGIKESPEVSHKIFG